MLSEIPVDGGGVAGDCAMGLAEKHAESVTASAMAVSKRTRIPD